MAKNKIIIILIIFVILVVGAGLFYFFIFNDNSTNNQGQVTVNTSEFDISNWTTYTDPRGDYTIKLPPTFTATDKNLNAVFYHLTSGYGPAAPGHMIISVDTMGIQDHKAQLDNIYKEPVGYFVKMNPVTVGGQSANRYIYYNNTLGANIYYYFVEHNDNTYEFQITESNQFPLHEMMIQTFAFKEQVNINGNSNINTTPQINVNVEVNTNSTGEILGMTVKDEPFVASNYNISLTLPENLYVIDVSDEHNRLEFSRSDNLSYENNYASTYLIIKTVEDEPAQIDGVNIYLDTLPSQTYTIAGVEADVYKFPHGYEGTPSFITFRIKVENIYYIFTFWNTSDINDELRSILDSVIINHKLVNEKKRTYTSEDFGITFQYAPTDGNNDLIITEKDDKIILYYDDNIDIPIEKKGQYIQKFDKDPGDSIKTAIEKKLLDGYDLSKCLIKDSDLNESHSELINNGWEAVYMLYEVDLDSDEPFNNVNDCPSGYPAVGGLNIFIENKDNPNNFYFLKIGQYSIYSEMIENNNYNDAIPWESTIELVE